MSASATLFRPAKVTVIKDTGGARTVLYAGTPTETEAVFTIVGILHIADVPPVSLSQIKSIGPKRLRQHVTIVGYDTKQFRRGVSVLETVAFEITRSFKTDEIKMWQPAESEGELGSTLSTNCRYFTLGANVPASQKTPFHSLVDPRNDLQSMLSSTVHHMYDNDVSYLMVAKGEYNYYSPELLKAGDMVEMGFTITAWKMAADNHEPKFTTNLVLRTLTFLDGTHTMASFI
ncbi:hypothetical protein C8R45DRAFT_1097456 [Mycena sanguinolenta]|nr:hypothetical protein C8R45DRAFT_1097456 [Mycena sanguinolenta]